jgi:radical SAM superfamily enzyme with C-terminal helix-hairpin-helix motif
MKTILDCYTDEPAGLGVPPYLGVYPRYIAGQIKTEQKTKNEKINYITIDDLRLYSKYNSIPPETPKSKKTDISVHNLTKNYSKIHDIVRDSDEIIIVAGAHTSGKYLSAFPGSLTEATRLLSSAGYKGKRYLAGPAASGFGASFEGGKAVTSKQQDFIKSNFDDIFHVEDDYSKLRRIAVKGTTIAEQMYEPFIAELETSRGCNRKKGCSFCLEPLKHCLEERDQRDVIEEATELRKYTPYFRLGKQSCFYSYRQGNPKEIEKLLKPLHNLKPKVLHIDNANPAMVDEDKTKLIVKYCTPGNIAAFGVESFDKDVIKANNLNSDPETTLKAVEIINKYGKAQGANGMPKFLPGINILFGLIGETKKTFDTNLEHLKEYLNKDLWIRRINIRQVIPFPETTLYKEAGNMGSKFLKKNKKYYWKAREKIRQEIDLPMLKKIFPKDSILKDVFMETYDGNHTFGRHIGTYPIIIGTCERVPIRKFYSVSVKKHNLRSIEAEVLNKR